MKTLDCHLLEQIRTLIYPIGRKEAVLCKQASSQESKYG